MLRRFNLSQMSSKPFGFFTSEQVSLVPIFLCKKISHLLHCSSFIPQRLAFAGTLCLRHYLHLRCLFYWSFQLEGLGPIGEIAQFPRSRALAKADWLNEACREQSDLQSNLGSHQNRTIQMTSRLFCFFCYNVELYYKLCYNQFKIFFNLAKNKRWEIY